MTTSGTTIQKKVCMVGAFAVGKTSLVARFVHSMFSEKYHTTIGVKVDKKTVDIDGRRVNLILWDLAGEDDFNTVRTSHLRGASGYLLVIDGTRRETLTTALDLQQRVEREVGPLPFHLLVNKSDLIDEWQLSDDDLSALASRGWHVTKTSAKTGTAVEEAFHDLARAIL
jgi:small GTP-binding protein